MKTIHLFKAQPTREPVESVTIVVDALLPQESVDGCARPAGGASVFEEQAKVLMRALILALPGATIDRLLVELLRHRQLQLIVASPQAEIDRLGRALDEATREVAHHEKNLGLEHKGEPLYIRIDRVMDRLFEERDRANGIRDEAPRTSGERR